MLFQQADRSEMTYLPKTQTQNESNARLATESAGDNLRHDALTS